MTLYRMTPVATAETQAEQLVAETALKEAVGTKADTAALNDTGEFTLMSFVKRMLQALTIIAFNTGTNAAQRTTTPTLVAKSVTTTSDVILAATTVRKKWFVYNPGNTTVYLEYGATAVVASSLPIPGGYLWIDDFSYDGTVSAVVAVGTQSIQIRSLN